MTPETITATTDDLADRLRAILKMQRTITGEQKSRPVTRLQKLQANAEESAIAYLAALDQIAALTAQLAEARATITESGWQPIETAPSARDNVDVLVWGPHLARVEFRLADGDWWRAPGTPKPTHWRPIPKGPSE